jgi:Zn finger protein HypA/HybF involved in hydrogenase expression
MNSTCLNCLSEFKTDCIDYFCNTCNLELEISQKSQLVLQQLDNITQTIETLDKIKDIIKK